MTKPADKVPAAARRTRKPRKKVVVEAQVIIGLDMVTPVEREAVERATASWDNFRRFTTDPRGVGASGTLRLVRVTPRFRLLYRETATRVHVLQLVNEGTLETYDVKTYPIPRPSRKKAGGRTRA